MSLASTLFHAEAVYDERNMHELIGDGQQVFAGGEMRYLSRKPPSHFHSLASAVPFEDVFQTISRSEWDARIDEQLRLKSRVSDHQDFAPYDQDGTNYCTPAGTLVRMGDGSDKPIEDVRALDEVLSAEGNCRFVSSVLLRHYDGPLVTLRMFGNKDLRLTAADEVLTEDGYTACSLLAPGTLISVHHKGQATWVELNEIETEHFSGTVYSIEVETDNSCVLEGVGVHNCWINGCCQAFTTLRRILGLPLVEISAASCGGPITGYRNVGGWEGDGMDYLAKHGGVDVKLWPNNAIDRSYATKPEVIENRTHHVALKIAEMGSDFDKWGTLALRCRPGAFAKNSMSHVMNACDLVRIEKGHYGLRFRNSWGNWGSKNDLGFAGYGTFREGNHYDSGWGITDVTPSSV